MRQVLMIKNILRHTFQIVFIRGKINDYGYIVDVIAFNISCLFFSLYFLQQDILNVGYDLNRIWCKFLLMLVGKLHIDIS